jgi:ATP-dependent Clp protease ATP-binding subunit ClpA
MFDNYSQQARRAVFFARAQAVRRRATEIGTEHLLCGLLEAGCRHLSAVLVRCDTPVESFWKIIESMLPPKVPGAFPVVDMPLGPSAKQICLEASRSADRTKGVYVGTRELLLGVAERSNERGFAILQAVGIDRQMIIDTALPND